MSSITEAIRARRLRAAKSSIAYGELTQRNVQNQLARMKRVLSGEEECDGLDPSVRSLRDHYYRMKSDYTQRADFAQVPELNKRAIALWTRVSNAWKESGVSQEHFIKAQFAWFHKSFGKSPDVVNLVTEAAIERAKTYAGSKHRVVGNNIKADVTTADMFRQCEKTVRDMCRAQKMTKKEFYQNFILTGEFSLPKKFLMADPVYRALVEGE